MIVVVYYDSSKHVHVWTGEDEEEWGDHAAYYGVSGEDIIEKIIFEASEGKVVVVE